MTTPIGNDPISPQEGRPEGPQNGTAPPDPRFGFRLLDAATIRTLVNEADALAAARRAFDALGRGGIGYPSPMNWRLEGGDLHVKGAWLHGSPIFALKAATGFPANVERDLPTGDGFMAVFDSSIGELCAILADEGYLTNLRTGAAGALAVHLLAPRYFKSVTMIGTGVQARFQLRALHHLCSTERQPWQDTFAWSPNEERCAAFCTEMGEELGRPVVPMPSAEEATREGDVLISATTSQKIVVHEEWLRPFVTVVAVGADSPGKKEMDPMLLLYADKVVVDIEKQCATSGDLQHALDPRLTRPVKVHAELGQIVVGAKAGRESLTERIVCDLTGTGAQDAAIAEVVWRKACAADLGRR